MISPDTDLSQLARRHAPNARSRSRARSATVLHALPSSSCTRVEHAKEMMDLDQVSEYLAEARTGVKEYLFTAA